MSTDGDKPSDEKTYWVAIQPSFQTPPNTFGPYNLAEANSNRASWIKSYPSSAKISAVFRAEGREQAEQNAKFHMPKR